MTFHDKSTKEVLQELDSAEEGISSSEAKKRLDKYGPNEIKEDKQIHPWQIILGQFKSPIVWILLAAMVIAGFVGEWTDFTVIAVIVILNAILGFVQEYRAEKAIAALQEMTALKATVMRDGKRQELPSKELVPGDVVLLATGDKVPADCRLLESTNLQTMEAALTGESTPVQKKTEKLPEKTGVADRKNMVHAGTTVTAGHATAVVTNTGHDTEIGKIATMIQTAEGEQTPLQKQLAKFSIWLTVLVVSVAAIVFLTGVLKGEPLFEFFLAAIALAVAAIPEGLPAVVTMALALGVQRMASRNALIRKLPSAETLGSCTVICSDKTGTLTHNQMTVRKVWIDGQTIQTTGSGYQAEGKFLQDAPGLELLLKIGVLNNDSKLEEKQRKTKVFGDPTEAALLVSAKKHGLDPDKLREEIKREDEIEFTSERKKMSTFHKIDGKNTIYTKGAPDIILENCNRVLKNGKPAPLDKQTRQEILEANEKYANQALRVLGFAYKEIGKEKKSDAENEMVFVGLQAMIDPPRSEAKKSIQECYDAGIKVVMITGDHLLTAKAIADELGIKGEAITGQDLESIEDLKERVEDIAIYARVNPEHKLKIVDALQDRGHVVAMTGDGVNDAPALKEADIGIAMGITGTDVSKEASEMILADDNFATIVQAVREGRRIFDNIGRFIEYLLSSNLGEVLTIFTAILIGWPLPLLAIQLLWINLVTDGLPAVALSVEPPAKDVMKRRPRKKGSSIIDKDRAIEMGLIGLTMMIGTLFVFDMSRGAGSLEYAQTMGFTTLVVMQLFNVLNQRSETESVFAQNPLTNIWLWLAVLSSFALQFVVVYVPFISDLFRTVPMSGTDWALTIGVSASILLVGELIKLVRRKKQ